MIASGIESAARQNIAEPLFQATRQKIQVGNIGADSNYLLPTYFAGKPSGVSLRLLRLCGQEGIRPLSGAHTRRRRAITYCADVTSLPHDDLPHEGLRSPEKE